MHCTLDSNKDKNTNTLSYVNFQYCLLFPEVHYTNNNFHRKENNK